MAKEAKKAKATGKFTKGVSGNPAGRPAGSCKRLANLVEAIEAVEKKKKKKFLIHAVERAYVDDRMLATILRKLIPDKKAVEVAQDGPMEIVVRWEK